MSKTIVAIYIRVSTQEQASEGYSIGEQKERLLKYADAHDWIVSEVYSDPGFSGAKLDRPAIKKLIRDVENHKVDKVIVFKLDRLSRSQKDTLYLIEDVFLKNNVDFVSMTENFDTATPFGKAMIGILSVFAQLEREQIKERLTLGRQGRAKSGLYTGNQNPPIGYNYVNGELIVDPYYADIVKRIFREFNSGKSVRSTTNGLAADGILTPSGKAWSGSTIRKILENPIYVGRVRFDNKEYAGIHEPIIDPENYNKALERLKDRREHDENYLRFSQKTSILTGLCYCPYCKKRKAIDQSDIRSDGKRRKYITCKNKKETGCPYPRLRVEEVEAAVLGEIRKLKLDPEYLKSCRTKSDSIEIKKRIETLKNHITENERKIDRLTDLYSINGIDLNSLKDRIEKLTSEISGNEVEIDNLKKSSPETMSDEEILNMSDLLEKVNYETEITKQIVSSLIERIDITDKELLIHWKF